MNRSRVCAVAVLVWCVGCGPGGETSTAPTVAVSFPALATLVAPVAGETPISVVGAGISPHAYEPRPSDLRRLASARITFFVDDELDGWIRELAAPNPVALYPMIPDSLRLPDRHFWLDPVAVSALVPGIAQALCNVNAASCPAYLDRAATFQRELAAIDERLQHQTNTSAVVVSGPYLTYFTRRYGPPVSAIVEPVEGVEPSPADMHQAILAARESGIVVIQPWLPERAARIVSETSGARLVSINPVAAESYGSLIDSVANALLGPLHQ